MILLAHEREQESIMLQRWIQGYQDKYSFDEFILKTNYKKPIKVQNESNTENILKNVKSIIDGGVDL